MRGGEGRGGEGKGKKGGGGGQWTFMLTIKYHYLLITQSTCSLKC